MSNHVSLRRGTNQALGIGRFAVDFMSGKVGAPSAEAFSRTRLLHTDAVLCGASALALRANAPRVLREEALRYPDPTGASPFGTSARVQAEKAVVANSSAMREWDSNGTNFGYNPEAGHTAGEFGHNDFYSVPVAACQQRGLGGQDALRGMLLLDEIRGRLAEVFSLKSYKIDHVVHGAIASAATYGALMGAEPEQIESAIGMFVAHYIPWRAIRAGEQLSDSKGASAGISAEAAVLSMRRALAGFVGPKDIFRNPESLFRQFVKTGGDSPFDLSLGHSGDDFAVMGMHFKIGLYEHQSAGALQGLLGLLAANARLLEPGCIAEILVRAYEPAFGIIGDPHKRDPQTRQSADHSMLYIVATMLRKALEARVRLLHTHGTDDLWLELMLSPADYSAEAIRHPLTRRLMEQIRFERGGPEYDAKYPDGIPTSIVITTADGTAFDSGLVMYPAGHARNNSADLGSLLRRKFSMLGSLALPDGGDVDALIERLENIESTSPHELLEMYSFEIADRPDLL